MNLRQANCPNCGGGLSFRPGTLMAVCGYCSSVVARTDRDLRLVGRVSALVDTHSPLSLGSVGTFQRRGFALVGRSQLRHPAGGVWDEWYLAFEDGEWGWLAEAQGQFYLTFEREMQQAPSQASLQPGISVRIGDIDWVVQETGTAKTETAAGELPFELDAQRTYFYADLSGPKGAFSTLDYGGEKPTLFLGRQVSLQELGLQGDGGYSDRPAIQTTALNCPHCAAPVPLRLPEQAQRVTCSACNSLLDATHGSLAYLNALPPARERILIAPGTEGTLAGLPWTSVGFVRRACVVEGITYPWDEYLLYNPERGFCWLIESTGHWTLSFPARPADVEERLGEAAFHNASFRKFQQVTATVQAVYGEFYWKVSVGEKVQSADYVAAPRILSSERATYVSPDNPELKSHEIAWSVGTYLTGDEVWKAFKLKGSPPLPQGVAPNQPNPYVQAFDRSKTQLGIFLGIFLVLMVVSNLMSKSGTVLNQPVSSTELTATAMAQARTRQLAGQSADPSTELPNLSPGGSTEVVLYSEPFQITDGKHGLEVDVSSMVDNGWLFIDGALVSEETGDISYFSAETSYYSGVEDGESWSEGSKSASAYAPAVKPGTYVARMAIQASPRAPDFTITVRQGQTRWIYGLFVLFVILVFPLIIWIRSWTFESRRWQESMYAA